MEHKYATFNGLNVSSKFGICGLPIRLDSYKTCSFGCEYCFSNNRKIMEFRKNLQVANLAQIERVIKKANENPQSFLEVLVADGITWHCGGMSDPFQPINKELQVTNKIVDITNKYGIHILFSTKSDSVQGCDIRPDLHTFQLSVSNVDNRKDIEPNVPNIEKRYAFYRSLKDAGFKVGIRIQPFIPNISTMGIVEMFHDADHFTLEGLKLVPQNMEMKEHLINLFNLDRNDFKQMGLLTMKPNKRLQMYEPFIRHFKKYGMSYSVSDNDMRLLGNNLCCCGDALVDKSSRMDTTYLAQTTGGDWSLEDAVNQVCALGCHDCKCSELFTSNRTKGMTSVLDFTEGRFFQKSAPSSPLYQVHPSSIETGVLNFNY